jgi:hypothetical protein
MKIQLSVAAIIAAGVLAPSLAAADVILDTGTPSDVSDTLTTSQWYAVEFQDTAADPIVTQLAAYLSAGGSGAGTTYTWDIYSAAPGSAFLNVSGANREAPLYTTSATFNGTTGWSTVDVSTLDWTLTPGQDYWVALQETTKGNTLDVVTGDSTTTGTVPALNFAFGSGTNPQFKTAGAPGIGVQISAVPLPAAAWLLGGGLVGLGSLVRRRRRSATDSQAA